MAYQDFCWRQVVYICNRHDASEDEAKTREAMEAAQGSTFLAETLGEPLVGLLIDNAARELDVVEREVPPSELARYLEAM